MKKIAVTLTAAALAVGIAAPADAAHRSVSDPRGDAVQGGYDIVHATFKNRAKSTLAGVKLDKLRRLSRVTVSIGKPDSEWVYDVSVRRRHGKIVTRMVRLRNGASPVPVDCKIRTRWIWKNDRVQVVVPNSCMVVRGKLSYGATVSKIGTKRPSDMTRSVDVARG